MMLAGLQRLAASILLLAAILCFYEGVPFAKNVPFIGALVEGRVAVVARLAAANALKGYVLESEKTALAAQLAEERRQRLAGAVALEEYRKRAAADEKQDAEIAARQEQEIAEYEKKLKAAGRSRLLDGDDFDYIMRD